MDATLKQLLAEIYACHRELEALRARIKELEAASEKVAAAAKPEPA